MVNIDDFIKRLEIILEYYNLSASAFADKISVQRSSLSHLLSGRNKPSLDFIIKVIEVFPEVDLYWVLIGKGNFPKSEINIEDKTTTIPLQLSEQEKPAQNLVPDLFSTTEKVITPNLFESTNKESTEMKVKSAEQEIERIVVFFKDGTFKNYNS